MQLLVHVVTLEDRQALHGRVVVLHPVGELGAHGLDVVPHLLAQDPHRQFGLPVEQARGIGQLRGRLDAVPLLQERGDVALELVGRGPFGRCAHDQAVPRRLHLVDDAAKAATLVVAQALGDAEGGTVGHQHSEAPGQGHLLGQPGALGPDGVLGHLAQDGLAGLEHVLDPGLGPLGAAPFDVVPVIAHVAPVQDGVLGDADIDEGRLHAGQDVLHPAPIDVAVDLVGVVRSPRDVVLDQRAALQHGDLGHPGRDVDADQVAPDLLAPGALAA